MCPICVRPAGNSARSHSLSRCGFDRVSGVGIRRSLRGQDDEGGGSDRSGQSFEDAHEVLLGVRADHGLELAHAAVGDDFCAHDEAGSGEERCSTVEAIYSGFPNRPAESGSGSGRRRSTAKGRFGPSSVPTPLQLFQLALQGLQLLSRLTELSGGGELLIVG